MDLFGRKIYATRELQIWISNHQAVLGRYNYNSCGVMAKFRVVAGGLQGRILSSGGRKAGFLSLTSGSP